jgi:stage II sporulation protein D
MGRLVAFLLLGVLVLICLPAFIIKPGNVDLPIKAPNTRDSKLKIKMYHHGQDKIMEIPMDQYLIGVLAAEMPASFEREALKAQAVAARTYTIRRLEYGKSNKTRPHPGADICNDPFHNQAWVSQQDMKSRWGKENFTAHYTKIAQAVWDTDGQIVLYQGEIIDPVYHASCGGLGTEDAEEVWSAPVPYLKGVACNREKDNPKAYDTKIIALQDLKEKLGPLVIRVSSRANFDLAVLSNTATGRIRELSFGGRKISGKELRTKLGLKSTKFSWNQEGDKIIFKTIGNGHGVGLCQYGANYMAKDSKDYEDILIHYYTGVELADYWRYMSK